MEELTLVIPMLVELKKGANGHAWVRLQVPFDVRVFFAIRYVLTCKPRIGRGTPKLGEIVRDFGGIQGKTTFEDTVTMKKAQRHHRTTLTKFLESSQKISSLSSTLAVALNGPLLAKSAVSALLSNTFKDCFSQTDTVTEEIEQYTEHTTKVTYEFEPNTAYYEVRAYRPMCYDVFITMMDYLFVAYYPKDNWSGKTSYYRRKQPDASSAPKTEQHPNRYSFLKVPLCCVTFYEEIDNYRLVERSQYTLELEEPYAHTIGMPERPEMRSIGKLPDLPTLYSITEKAFPRKYDSNLEQIA